MTANTFSSREFNQDAGRAKKAAKAGPVFITDRGKPAHVLMTIEDYRRIAGKAGDIVDLLALDDGSVGFDPPHASPEFYRPADLS